MTSRNGRRTERSASWCVLANYDTAPDKLAMSRWPDRQLVDCMDNRQAPLAHRMVAAWLLSGSHEFHAVTVLRQSSRHHRHLIRLMVDRGLPGVPLYLAHKAVSRLREDMFISLLFMHEMLLRISGTSFRQPTSIAAVMIGPLLAAAYDMHTREGLLALQLFAERVPPIQRYLDQVPADQRSRLMRFGVFLAEGARLASQLGSKLIKSFDLLPKAAMVLGLWFLYAYRRPLLKGPFR